MPNNMHTQAALAYKEKSGKEIQTIICQAAQGALTKETEESSLMKKILVTGGAGYIGSHTCLELLKRRLRSCGSR